MSTAVFGAPGFKAHSGRTVRVGEDGTVMFDKANGYLSPQSAMDAEEFYLDKRDRDLKRWRDPLNPDYVVYEVASVAGARVVNERDGRMVLALRGDAGSFEPQGETRGLFKAAWAYFEDHPERKPWDGAEPGDVWVLTLDGVDRAAVVDAAYDFTTSDEALCFGSSDMDRVTAARRIWPEVAS